MYKAFAFDLKVARRKSGLSQSDCAHLLDVDRTKISRLEQGDSPPSIRDICTLSLVYGKSFESLFGTIFEEVREGLQERLTTIPALTGNRISQFNRTNTLNDLASRLNALTENNHEGA
ncbi:MAG: hypothetical protein COA84_15890 [Robiginitomaculum sp.]|nr:MAG: hypothetical protein COA84_15890 [Robiginitomaculum sp.]